ncbi:PLAC8-like protein 1 isoform X2 [Clinocottus analis]|uniref:PLAC8-like protein 1 isoform X2 n=1 Tax=Clinocottus analis TaxID=304258 RepID=UPI0035BEE685
MSLCFCRFWPSHSTAGLSAPTHTLSLGKCHSPLHLLIPADSLAHPVLSRLLFSPLSGCQQPLVMEQMTVTHQPRLSVTRGSVSVFEEKEVGGFTTGKEVDLRSNNVPAATDPVLTQPGLGITTTTITTITQTGGDWTTGLFDVCGDKTTCVLGALVPCCLDLSLAHQYGECLCVPLLPGSTFAMRVGIRERYKIRGSVCEDWTTVCCCYPLAVCQMIREMKRRMKTQTYHVSTALQCS